MNCRVKCKVLSVMLAASLCLTSGGTVFAVNSVEAAEPETAPQSGEAAEATEPLVLPDIVRPEDAESSGYVARVKEDEKDLCSFVFENSDGTRTMELFSHPVKYVDSEGEVKDISLALRENKEGDYVTADNDIITTFHKHISDGIGISYQDTDLLMVPQGVEDTALSIDKTSRKVTYSVSPETAYEYELTYLGYKENIVVSEYTGQTEYTFTLHTNGLTLSEEAGSLRLLDEKGETKARFSEVTVFTADNRQYEGTMTGETVKEAEEYRLTLHVDADFLQDPSTQYPIRIDPSIEIENGVTGALSDTTLCQGYPDANYGNLTSLYVGKRNGYGVSRALLRIGSDSLGIIESSAHVLSASLRLHDIAKGTDSAIVRCHMFEGYSWSETSAAWNNSYPNYYSTKVDEKTVSYSVGLQQDVQHRYEFNIKGAVKKWVDGSFKQVKGLIFDFENDLSMSTNQYKQFGSCEHTSKKPSIKISYRTGLVRNSFYSKYDPDRFNDQFTNTSPEDYAKVIRIRMNCYGYAFCNILNGAADCSSYGTVTTYGQQPGEFASASDRFSVKDLGAAQDSADLLNRVAFNMKLDADRLGYTLTVYTPTSDTVEQFGTNSRLIAVVADFNNSLDLDYHFYMQHSDGSWSHKNGWDNVQNQSFSLSNNEHYLPILTNENIRTRAKAGRYKNEVLRFYIITRTAEIDHRHYHRCCDNWSACAHGIPVSHVFNECAGDYAETSTLVYAGASNQKASKISFTNDDDHYYFTATSSKTYRVTATITSGSNSYSDLQCKVFNADGDSILAMDLSSGNVSLNVAMAAGCQYLILIYDKNHNSTVLARQQLYDYTIKIEELS